ncbi:MAG: hypothetical protein WD648_11585 [Planctomycetaceae bacterium]
MTKIIALHGVVLVVMCAMLCGCRPEVDYSPPKSKKAGTATKTDRPRNSWSGDDKSPAEKFAQEKTVAVQETFSDPGIDLIAFDEFDGINRGGWKEPGLGEWAAAGVERNGALIVAGDVDIFRALAEPVTGGVLWYAVTMHMETSVTGFVSIAPSEDGKNQFVKMGFSAIEKPYTSRGFWIDADSDTRIENTQRQTFLTRHNFEIHRIEGYAEIDEGLSLVAPTGLVISRPRLYGAEGTFTAKGLSHLRMHKRGPEKLIIDRVAIARKAATALIPQTPVSAPRPKAAATTENAKPAEAAAANKAG